MPLYFTNMSRKTSNKYASGQVPLRVPDEMRIRALALAEKSGLSLADVLRLSIERGMPKVESLFKHPETEAA